VVDFFTHLANYWIYLLKHFVDSEQLEGVVKFGVTSPSLSTSC